MFQCKIKKTLQIKKLLLLRKNYIHHLLSILISKKEYNFLITQLNNNNTNFKN